MKRFIIIFFALISLQGICQTTSLDFLTPFEIQSNLPICTGITSTTQTWTWVGGNRTSRIVLMKSGSAVSSNPVTGTGYTASSTFTSGTQIGSGNYVVYSGTGSTVTVTGLSADTYYYVSIYEFNGSGSTSSYNTSLAPVGNAKTFTTLYQAAITWAGSNTGTPPASLYYKVQEDGFISGLNADGQLSKVDQLCFYNTFGDDNWSLINMITPGTGNHTKVGTITRVAGVGWTGDHTTGYLRTHMVPSTAGGQFAQNNAGIVIYSPTPFGSSTTDYYLGALDASSHNAVLILMNYSGPSLYTYFNSINPDIVTSPNKAGLYQFNRTGASTTAAYVNGSSVMTGTAAVEALPTHEMYVCAANNNGTASGFSKYTAGFWMIGSAFNAAQVNTRYTNMSIETLPTVSFATYTDPPTPYKIEFFSEFSLFPQVTQGPAGIVSQTTLSTSITGTYLWQGGTNTPNDQAYFAPANSHNIGKFNTLTETLVLIAYAGFNTDHQFSAAVYDPGTNKIFFCAYGATAFMVLDCTNDAVSYFDDTGMVADAASGRLTADVKWNGIHRGSDGNLYCIPWGGATNVAVINPKTLGLTFFDTSGSVAYNAGNLAGSAKWDSSIAYGDFIYGSPSTITTILKVNTLNRTCSIISTSLSLITNQFGLSVITWNKKIMIFPYLGTKIMVIDPENNDAITFSDSWPIPVTLPSSGGAIQVSACSTLPDGKILTVAGTGGTPPKNLLVDPAALTVVQTVNPITNQLVGQVMSRNGYSYGIPYDPTTCKITKSGYSNKIVNWTSNFVTSEYIIKGGY